MVVPDSQVAVRAAATLTHWTYQLHPCSSKQTVCRMALPHTYTPHMRVICCMLGCRKRKQRAVKAPSLACALLPFCWCKCYYPLNKEEQRRFSWAQPRTWCNNTPWCQGTRAQSSSAANNPAWQTITVLLPVVEHYQRHWLSPGGCPTCYCKQTSPQSTSREQCTLGRGWIGHGGMQAAVACGAPQAAQHHAKTVSNLTFGRHFQGQPVCSEGPCQGPTSDMTVQYNRTHY